MSIDMTIIVSLLSGTVGSILTLSVSKYMSVTSDRKQKGEELIPLLTNIKERLNDLTKIKSYNEEFLKDNYKSFQFDKGAVETITKFYFSKKTSRIIQQFLHICEGVHLKVEIELFGEEIKLLQKSVEEEAATLLRAESQLEEFGDDGDITLGKVKEYMSKQSEIDNMKKEIESQIAEMQESVDRNKVHQYRLKEKFKTDSLEVLLENTNVNLKNSIRAIHDDYSIKNRLN